MTEAKVVEAVVVEETVVEEKAVDFKEIAGKAGDLAKNIWLAGLGAYGKAIDEAQGQYDKVTGKVKEVEQKAEKGTVSLFDELVAKGKKLEEDTQVKLSEVKEKASLNLEDRLSQVKSNLNFISKGSSTDLEDQLTDISGKLDSILDSLSPSTAAPVKKTASRKSASSEKAEA